LKETRIPGVRLPDWVLAKETNIDRKVILLVNIYGKLHVNPYVVDTVHQALNALAPVLKSYSTIILGGDLNTSLEYGRKNGYGDESVLTRIRREFGLRDCTKGIGAREIITQKSRNKTYQVD
jgi:hypothetical protein